MLFILFTLDSERYVIDATQVERLMPLTPQSPPKTIPGAPSWVAGVLDHEGAPLPLIDLPALALGRPAAQLMSTRVVLVRYPHAGTTRLLALLLEGATRTIRLDVTAFHDAGLDMPHARYLGPVASEAGGLVQWIRVEHLLPDDIKALLFPEAHA
ncbi:chemotaxis-related protein WspB [Paraburkholderia sp. BL6669N2]|uniref:chemotaxis protein CheW n=1 Tax=unclassified Paraburkholderia TaxID=2615204 RepID=UPI000E28838E|nr:MULTISPECIES: chemotaxis protein CheW [unclassified Paraburkholderia]REG60506.1 chemotaxis-related protein WspB [Paraburkholderia sp. BL6669N2]TDY24830.1 chemotaxis-related protein WspB [Paraburkholderia sp. BL6665CI2N2]